MSIITNESFSSVGVSNETVCNISQIFFCILDCLCVSHNVSFFLVCNAPRNEHLCNCCFCWSTKSFNEHILSFFKCCVYINQTFWCFECVIFHKIELAEIKEIEFKIFVSQQTAFFQHLDCLFFIHSIFVFYKCQWIFLILTGVFSTGRFSLKSIQIYLLDFFGIFQLNRTSSASDSSSDNHSTLFAFIL